MTAPLPMGWVESDRRYPDPNCVRSRYSTPVSHMMDLRLVSVNDHRLRSNSKRSYLLFNLRRRGIDTCLQETRFDSNFLEAILSRDYLYFSACFEDRSRGVTWLISRRLILT